MSPLMAIGYSVSKLKTVLKGKTVLVTGGTGSFGHAIVDALLPYRLKEIRIYSRGEDKQEKMKYEFRNSQNLRFILGDIRDLPQLTRASNSVDYAFHAAAQKQVPATETQVLEAVKTNVLGAQNVIDAAIACRLKKVIAISTDKAVEPVNAMGMTKALQEKLFTGANLGPDNRGTVFSCARYGNVLGSTGSVLPLFMDQIKSGSAVTVTVPEMTRFLLTLKEAIDLVFVSLLESVGGEVFVPDIPSHTVMDLAETLCRIHSYDTGRIRITGVRAGEKIHETLITPTESVRSVTRRGYFVILPQYHMHLTDRKYRIGTGAKMYRFASDTARHLNPAQLRSLLQRNRVK